MAGPTRRTVLRMAAVGAAATAVPLGVAAPASAAVRRTVLRRSMFTPRVGTAFSFANGRQRYVLTLSGVEDLPHGGKGAARQFSLRFRGHGRLRSGTYLVRHSSLAPFSMYVGPVGSGATSYEAVINS